jgi:hypothetical protein
VPRTVFIVLLAVGFCGLGLAVYVRHRTPQSRLSAAQLLPDQTPCGLGIEDLAPPWPPPRRLAVQPWQPPRITQALADKPALAASSPTVPSVAPLITSPITGGPRRETPVPPPDAPQTATPDPERLVPPATPLDFNWGPAEPLAPHGVSPDEAIRPQPLPPVNLIQQRLTAASRAVRSLCGAWQDSTRRIRLGDDGRIVVTEDMPGVAAGGDLPSGRPTAYVLTGRYQADERELHVAWDDGPRTTYRWQLQDGWLWLTSQDDCHYLLRNSYETTAKR